MVSISAVTKASALRASWRHIRAVHKKTYMLREGTWAAVGQLAGAAGVLVGLRLLTEFISPGVFGSVSLLIGFATLGSNVFCVPQMRAAMRFYPDLSREQSVHRLRGTLRHGLMRTTALLVGAILLIGIVISALGYLPYWTFIALVALLIAEVARSFETSLLVAARRQKAYGIWYAAESWARPLLAILAVIILGITPLAVLTGYAAATTGLLALMPLWVKREGYDAESLHMPDVDLRRRLWRYVLPLMPLGIVAWISSLSDRYIIGGLIDMHAVGIYAAAYGLISRPFLLAHETILLTLRPGYFEAVSTQMYQRAQSIFGVMLGVNLLVALLGVGSIYVLKNLIGFYLLADSFRSAVDLMPWIALGYGMIIVTFTIEQYFYAHEKTHLISLMESIGATVSVVVTIPMVYCFGISGAAIAISIYSGLQLALGTRLLMSNKD